MMLPQRRPWRRGVTCWRALFGGVMLGLTAAFTTFCLLIAITTDPGNPHHYKPVAGKDTSDQYTLPSLEEVLKSSQDLDLQRVLAHYKLHRQPIPPNTPSVRVILASTWRSGSTLLGEVIGAHPGVYYHYEPFMQHGVRQMEDTEADVVNNLLKDLFRCDYRKLDDYLRFAFVNADLFARNTRLWSMCSALPRTKCYAPDILTKLCGLFPIHVAKLVRVRLSLLERQLADRRVKIVWLVRDPRAVMHSRRTNVEWCSTPSCNNPGHMCKSLYEDYLTYIRYRKIYPDQVFLLRYEDIARDAYNRSSAVLGFIGLNLQAEVVSYLDDHLSTNVDVPWSTKHEPKAAMSRWLKSMNWDEVQEVQSVCRSFMKVMGYRVFENANEMVSGNAVGLLNLPK